MDPRIARSRARLQDALLALTHERALDDITIGDIARQAGVNRSTFYEHYDDKQNLLADALEAAIPGPPSAPAIAGGDLPIELRRYLEHIADHRDLYRRVFGVGGSSTVRDRLGRHFTRITREAIARQGTTPFDALPLDIAAAGVTGSIIGIITAWVEREPLPPVADAESWIRAMLVVSGESAQ